MNYPLRNPAMAIPHNTILVYIYIVVSILSIIYLIFIRMRQQVTLGQLIGVLATFFLAGLGAYVNLKQSQASHETRIQNLETTYTKLEKKMDDNQNRTELKLDNVGNTMIEVRLLLENKEDRPRSMIR